MIPEVDTLRERVRRRAPARWAVAIALLGAAYVGVDYASYGTVDRAGLWFFALPLIVIGYVAAVVTVRRGNPARISPAAGLVPADRWRVMSGIARGRLDADPSYRAVQLAEIERLGASAGAWPIWVALAAVNWWLFALSIGDRVQLSSVVTALLFSGLATFMTALSFGMRRIERRA